MTFISEAKSSLPGLEEDVLIQMISFLEPPDILRLAQVRRYSSIDIKFGLFIHNIPVTLTDVQTVPRNYGSADRLGQCMQIPHHKQRLPIPQWHRTRHFTHPKSHSSRHERMASRPPMDWRSLNPSTHAKHFQYLWDVNFWCPLRAWPWWKVDLDDIQKRMVGNGNLGYWRRKCAQGLRMESERCDIQWVCLEYWPELRGYCRYFVAPQRVRIKQTII